MGRRAGRATVRRHGTVWQARYTLDGIREEVSTGLPVTVDESRAQEEAERLHAQAVLDAGRRRRPTGVADHRLDTLYERYFRWLGSQGRDERYVREQKIHFRAHFLCTDEEGIPTRWEFLSDITSPAIAAYQSERMGDPEDPQISTVTLYKELVSLSQFLKWCKREGLLQVIPEFTRPTQVSDYTPPNLSPPIVQRLLRALPTRAQDEQGHPVQEWATFTWAMALRFTESTRVEWRDADLDGHRLTVRAEIDKAGREWVLPLDDVALRILRAQAKRAGARPAGPIWHVTRMMRDKLPEVAEGLGLPHVTAHHLRHFRASELANGTRRLASVQYFLRHTSIATTALYVRSHTEAAEEMLAEVRRAARTRA